MSGKVLKLDCSSCRRRHGADDTRLRKARLVSMKINRAACTVTRAADTESPGSKEKIRQTQCGARSERFLIEDR